VDVIIFMSTPLVGDFASVVVPFVGLFVVLTRTERLLLFAFIEVLLLTSEGIAKASETIHRVFIGLNGWVVVAILALIFGREIISGFSIFLGEAGVVGGSLGGPG
jgi:hypothetical protein